MQKYWGYDAFLPLQERAMHCVRSERDSIVVLPTGGGKSLCFQVPALRMSGMAVVISPLISLMKDQVDALVECGIDAGRMDSTQSVEERNSVIARIRNQKLKLLYLAPERLFSNGFIDFLRQNKVSFIAIDEAHCVSMWGHDFRPEYRQLGILKKSFPGMAVHAYTATATEKVRQDIAQQLCLENPEIIIGSFDRANLNYKIEPLANKLNQVCDVLDRHKSESGIIYCIRRADVDSLCEQLADKGYKVAPYHAGMANEQRKENQEAFINEKIDIIVATVAFGMGIDKSNVRYVIHTGMPKSLEHYQQESGRAGRDGLEAECCLFYSGGDYGVWKSIMRDMEPQAQQIALDKLDQMYSFCTGIACRHQGILNYFGQDLGKESCDACDVCLDQLDTMDDSLEIAQKILSCILRLQERFGGDYTALVLTGSRDHRILEFGHDTLSTYGLLSDFRKRIVRDWIGQLIGQNYIQKVGEYNVLNVTEKGWRVLKGQESPDLLKPAKKQTKTSKIVRDSWLGVDEGLFESLRTTRRKIAQEKNVPAYVIFGDAALRDMARRRPSTLEGFLEVNGVGQTKCQQYGQDILEVIKDYCHTNGVDMDAQTPAETCIAEDVPSNPSKARSDAFNLFSQELSIKEVAQSVNRAESTTVKYLLEYIKQKGIDNPYPWIDNEQVIHRIADAAEKVGTERLKPIFDYLEGEISYDQIRITLACLGQHR
ncbi:MAG: DNA helicase RecQ [Sedimentisphaerales bacterium]|nr:DNA helicase RecQ [Sedimentisphaerales bacterium]